MNTEQKQFIIGFSLCVGFVENVICLENELIKDIKPLEFPFKTCSHRLQVVFLTEHVWRTADQAPKRKQMKKKLYNNFGFAQCIVYSK